MIERTMRQKLVQLLRPIGAYPVENGGCWPGTPDISTVPGPIECKATNRWPARSDTPVRLDHDLSQQQRIFIMKWRAAGGKAWVMLTVEREWLLFEGLAAVADLGGTSPGTRQVLYESALATWNRTPTTEELMQWIR